MKYTDLPFGDCQSGTDGEILCFALDRARKEFAWKTGELTAEQLRRTHPPSTLTLAGLMKHLAGVEDGFTAAAEGRKPGPPWDAVDREAEPRWEWTTAVTDDPEELYALWYGTVSRTRATWAGLIQDGGLDVIVPWGDDSYQVSRRRILVDLLEENLIHLGHVDILTEAITGRRGHGWPD
ncbi:MAG TPA: DUF664 domain-containing protein [Mycobacteriales bacterium]|nr:DUF664 domain-containing protein [Mycobacteriales bacterium]